MAILYTLVARGSVVLAEFSATQTNASAIARQILEKIPGTNDSHVSYSQDRYIFHVNRTDGITALCMADDTAGRRIPFVFLEDIHGRFVKTYGRACHSALAYAMNDEFSRVLSQQMDYYSNDPNADRINRIRGEMSQEAFRSRGSSIEDFGQDLKAPLSLLIFFLCSLLDTLDVFLLAVSFHLPVGVFSPSFFPVFIFSTNVQVQSRSSLK